MTIKTHYIKGLLTMVILFVMLGSFVPYPWSPPSIYTAFQIRTNSVLEVNGKTNINSFCCTSNELFSQKKLTYQIEKGTSFINFQNTSLDITIKKLDCGAKGMNKDLYKTLQADHYPKIKLDLKQVINLECNDLSDCDRWAEFEVLTDITIVCTSQSVSIPIQVKKLDEHSFRIIGSVTIELCDFSITPPTALMGLIKVKDAIEINFDLFVDLLRQDF